jgi:hypothetical protein
MHKTLLKFIILLGVSYFTCANASSIATITTLEPPVWVQQNNIKTELSRNSLLKVGDNIITRKMGRVEMRLWSSTMLRLNSNSDITILLEKNSDVATPYDRPRLYLDKGMACINFLSNADTSNELKLNIGNTMFAVILGQGDICVTRKDGLSSIRLLSGSVQVTHSVDPNLIVLSEIGTEFHIDDKGSFELLFPSADDPTSLVRDEFDEEDKTLATAEKMSASVKPASAEEAPKVEPEQPRVENIYEAGYRVYLFSSRSKNVAKKVSQKFQKAGHSTNIYTHKSLSDTFYRIAVPGFKTAIAAKEFSQSIVGTLGITETWIGK